MNFLWLSIVLISAGSDRGVSTTREKVILGEEVLVLKGAPQTYKKLILENSKIRISILPELGGKIYELIPKQSGNNQFYKNTIWKRVKDWGVNSIRKNGNWL